LKDFASYDFQKTIWFENEYKLCSSFDEDVEKVFLDSGLGEVLAEGRVVFGNEADASLKKLQEACDMLGYDWAGKEKELLELPGMGVVRDLAKHCLNLIRKSNGFEGTVELADSEMIPHGLSFPDRDI